MAHSEKNIAVFDEVKSGRGNIAIQAGPGTGKTYTLLESLKIIPRLRKTIFLSFSNTIVNELRERIPAHVKASTLHSLGCGIIKSKYRDVKVDVDGNKYFEYALRHFPKKTKEVYRNCYQIRDLCNYARLTLSPFEEQDLIQLCETYSLDCNPESILIATIILQEHANLKHLTVIDFADMIFLSATNPDLVNDFYDYILVDEWQDLNNAQTQLIDNIVRKPNGRVIAVGDFAQSIYGFSGSSVESFQDVQKKFKTKVLPLTVTYRCSKEVVKLAQTVYPEVIEAHPEAIEGEVRDGSLDEAQPGDMVLCRNTKPLVAAFFDYINRGVKSYIVGKDYEKGLVMLAEAVQGATKESTKQNVADKLDKQIADLEADGVSKPTTNPKFLALFEKCDILLLILEKCHLAHELVGKIKDIFHEDKKAIRLMSIHRSKGLESENVFYIQSYRGENLLPSKYAIQEWSKKQEQNLRFVCYTRAKSKFIFCDL